MISLTVGSPPSDPSFNAVLSLSWSPLAVKAAMETILFCLAFKPSLHGLRLQKGCKAEHHDTAAAAARFGFRCILILTGDAPTIKEANTLLDSLLGAEIVWTVKEKRDEVLQETFNSCWENGQRPYLIPYGGSNGTGAAAYAYAFQELHQQMDSVDWVVFASSSGGTQAGLAIGAQLVKWPGHLLGISVDQPESILKIGWRN